MLVTSCFCHPLHILSSSILMHMWQRACHLKYMLYYCFGGRVCACICTICLGLYVLAGTLSSYVDMYFQWTQSHTPTQCCIRAVLHTENMMMLSDKNIGNACAPFRETRKHKFREWELRIADTSTETMWTRRGIYLWHSHGYEARQAYHLTI